MVDRDGTIWAPVPERLDRRLRLGPFASGRDAVKFVVAAAVGAVASTLLAPWVGLPIVALGAVVALWKPDGEAIDERLVAFARWSIRGYVPGRGVMPPRPRTGPSSASIVRLPDGRCAVALRAAGVPLAFLPPADVARQFERYRELLRSVDADLVVVATSAPIHVASVVPGDTPAEAGEHAARDGYRELVTLLARRRAVRRVLVAVIGDEPGADGARRLEITTSLLRNRLADLGIRSERLRGSALAHAAAALGWAPEGATP